MTTPPPPPLGLAIVGCGQIMTHHLAAMVARNRDRSANSAALVVRALCDPSSERRNVIKGLDATQAMTTMSEEDIPEYDTMDDLEKDENVLKTIDVIFIAVPHDLHERLALQALELDNGRCWVVMEKPLAPTKDACERLIQSSLDYGRRLLVAEQSPYWQEVKKAKDLIFGVDRDRTDPDPNHKCPIGTIVSASVYYYESMRDNVTSGDVDSASGGLGWRGSLARAGGGIALDGGLHWIRPMQELCGRVSKVFGVIRNNLAPQLQMEGESLGHAICEINDQPQPTGSGSLMVTYSCHMLATAPMAHDACPYFRITGTDGELIIPGDGLFKDKPGAGGLRLYNDEYPEGHDLFPPDRLGGFFLGFQGLWEYLAHVMNSSDRDAAHETVVRAADDVRVALALYASSKSGRWESTI